MDGTVVTVAPFLLMVGNVNSYAKTVVLTYAIMFMDVLLQKLGFRLLPATVILLSHQPRSNFIKKIEDTTCKS